MKTKMQEAIICLAAGPSQVLVIKKAREMGFRVIAVDQNPKAVGFAFADEKIVMSTYEPIPIINRLRDFKKYEIRGLINRSSGPPVVTAARISRAFSLPGIDPDTAEVMVSKFKLNTACRKEGIRVPDCQVAQALTEVNLDKVSYPAIIKPSLSLVGKGGVRIVKRQSGLQRAFGITKEFSCDGWVNIEKYIDGEDICLMAMVQNGKLLPVVMLDELNRTDEDGRICGVGFAVPSKFSDTALRKRILDLAQEIVVKFQLQTTVFIMACRCRQGDLPYLIEIHLDLGGDLILDELLPASSDFDFIKYAINILTGQAAVSPKTSFLPAAIFYQEGAGLVNERPFRIIKGNKKNVFEDVLKEAHT